MNNIINELNKKLEHDNLIIKHLLKENTELSEKNIELENKIDKAIDMCIVAYGGNEDFYVDRIIKIKQELERDDSNE